MRFFYQTVEQNLVFFYEGYVVKALLGLVGIFCCPKCECLCLEPDKTERDGENSVSCGITGNARSSLLNQENFTGYAPLADSLNQLNKLITVI